MLDVGAADRRGALGPQRQRAAAAVVEAVHLLLHDVGGLADAAGEQLGGLEVGRLDAVVAGGAEDALACLRRSRRRSLSCGRTSKVPRGAWIIAAPPSVLGGSRSGAASSRRNGLVARSRPSVVAPMWPGIDAVSAGNSSISDSIEASSVGQSPPGRSTRPTEPWKRTSPEKQRVLVADRVGHMAGAVAGGEDGRRTEARRARALAAGDACVGLVALERAEARPRHVGVMLASSGVSSSGQYTGAPVASCDRLDRADVVEVAVREQDRLERLRCRARRAPRSAARPPRPGRRSRLVRPRAAHEVAVLLHRADGEDADVGH